jgi:mutator family transposase
LGDEYKLSGSEAYARVISQLNTLPDNTWLTREYSDPTKFSGILVLDGKFVKVADQDQKIPFIYGIDYLTHDIPVGILAKSESHLAFTELFHLLKKCNYPLRVVVCDDRMTVKSALAKAYPHAKIQLCQNHFLENLRRILHVRTEDTYQRFFASLRDRVFLEAQTEAAITTALRYVMERYGEDKLCRMIVTEINARRDILFQYLTIPDCPRDTNLVELYNSHLQARLKSIKSFQSVPAAKRWLNAYLIRRRTKTLTDCDFKFKHLNGYPSLFWTIKKQAEWPVILGLKAPEHRREEEAEVEIARNPYWFRSG